jgi:hypothetical protein
LQLLADAGFKHFLRPAAPPHVPIILKDGERVSDGKIPSQFRNGKWFGQRWRETAPTDASIAQWANSPGVNCCLVTGEVIAFDVDVKVDRADQSEQARRWRALADRIVLEIAEWLEMDASELAVRRRDDNSSCAVFLRWQGPQLHKRAWRLIDRDSKGEFKMELLATGQHIVVDGKHKSGGTISTNLAEIGFAGLPSAYGEDDLSRLIESLTRAADDLGFDWSKGAGTTGEPRAGATRPPRSAEDLIERAIWNRRRDWLASVLPFNPDVLRAAGDWSVSSEELERPLEERIAIFAQGLPGARDFGSERNHSPISLIMEFGEIDGQGGIRWGGSPEYGEPTDNGFPIAGEADPSIRRPTSAEAATWLARQLAGPEFPSIQPSGEAGPLYSYLADALGLPWSAVHSAASLWALDVQPGSWSRVDIEANTAILAALELADENGFAQLENGWFLSDAIEADLSPRLAAYRQRHTEQVVAGTRPESSPAAAHLSSDWPEPVDIFGDGDPVALSDVPVNSMPPALERYARDVAERMGVPVAFTAAGAVATASAAVGGSICLQPKAHDHEWTVPPYLWFLLVEDPGGKKSPVISQMVGPLVKLDSRRAAVDVPQRNQWEFDNKNRKKSGVPLTPRPPLRRSVVDSFTVEGLRDVLVDNPKGVLVSADEITGLIGGLDQYKAGGGSDRADLLKLMDAKPRTFDRVGKSWRIERWGASVFGGVQPKKLSEMAKSLDPDGLLQRFIAIVGDNVRRMGEDRRPDDAAASSYSDVITGLADMPAEARRVTLSPEAQDVREAFDRRVMTLLDMPTSSDAWRGHLNKWLGYYPRLMLVFHMVEQWETAGAEAADIPVARATAERAARFAEFLLAHAIRFYETVIGTGDTGRAVRTAAGIILVRAEEGVTVISAREIYERHREWRPDKPQASELYAAMRALGHHGWCRSTTKTSGGTERWALSPLLRERFKSCAAAEVDRIAREYERVQAGVAARREVLGGALK